MTPDQSAAIQAYAAVAQAVFASFAIAVAVGVPIWQQRQSAKIKLTVTPKLTWVLGQHGFHSMHDGNVDKAIEKRGRPSLTIEVVNRSLFHVVIDEVGLCEVSPRRSGRMILNETVIWPNRVTLPVKMPPLSHIHLMFDKDYCSYGFIRKTRPYVSTVTNDYYTGTSAAFSSLMKSSGRVSPWLSE